MRYVAAYMLAILGGNKAPSEEDVKKILSSVGAEYDAEASKKVVSELSGKEINQLMEDGLKKLATIPSGGGAGAAPAAAAAGGAAAAAPEEKKEEKKEEEEEEDEDMGFSLFD